jgi:acetolactate synthase regulatory subunit
MENEANSRLLSTIDREIEDAQREAERGGWTTWAVVGASASLFWLATDLLNERPNLLLTTQLFLAAYFAVEAIRHISGLFEGAPRAIRRPRFILGNTLASFRQYVLTGLMQNAALLLLIFYAATHVNLAGTVSATVVITLMMLSTIVVLLWTYTDLPLPTNLTGRIATPTRVIGGVLGIALLIACVSYLEPVLQLTFFPLNEIRLAAIALGLYLLVPIATRSVQANPLVGDLRELRRSIIFDEVPPEEAKHRAEIVISGMRATDVMRDQISQALSMHGKLREQLGTLHQHADTCTLALREAEGASNPTELREHLQRARYAYQTAHELRNQLSPDLTHLNNIVRSIARRGAIMITIVPDTKEDIERVTGELTLVTTESLTQAESLMERLHDAERVLSTLEALPETPPVEN